VQNKFIGDFCVWIIKSLFLQYSLNTAMQTSIVDRLLKNMGNMHELGRQRAFELGNPFYAQFEEDGEYWRKEMPTGEKYLVTIEVIMDDNDMPVRIKDSIIKKLD
jgi:hypothetical protein